MSEGKTQNWFVPLRVRFRPQTDTRQWESVQGIHSDASLSPETSTDDDSTAPSLPIIRHATFQQNRQIKELIRLGNLLRAEQRLDQVLEQVISSIHSCLGFRASVLKMIEDDQEYLTAVAFAGVSEEDKRTLQAHPMGVNQMLRMMMPEFQVSQSYFISHKHIHLFDDVVMVGGGESEELAPGYWHPMDMLIVPLYSPHQRRLLGFLSLDDPINGKVPTEASIEMAELFANQAAIAIDNARFFQEKETERLALEKAILDLRLDLERVQRGDLGVRVRSSHEKLEPVTEAINLMLDEMSSVLGAVQMVTLAVDEHTQGVQHHSDLLVKDASQQERQVQHIARAVDEMDGVMQRVSEIASKITNVSIDALDVNAEGQGQIARAIEGMRQVREITMHSSRAMKQLGERGQEINDTVAEISDLTTRMNLLALNAAIEAVRAGDQGQGFVVIAQEIRSLAVTSAEGARKVAARLRAIQHETSTVTERVEQNIQQVVMQSELVNETGVALDAISVVTTQMANLVQEICDAAANQSQGSHRVSYSVEEISRMASEITRHMLEMQQSLAHLVELTNLLRTRLSIFRIPGEEA